MTAPLWGVILRAVITLPRLPAFTTKVHSQHTHRLQGCHRILQWNSAFPCTYQRCRNIRRAKMDFHFTEPETNITLATADPENVKLPLSTPLSVVCTVRK